MWVGRNVIGRPTLSTSLSDILGCLPPIVKGNGKRESKALWEAPIELVFNSLTSVLFAVNFDGDEDLIRRESLNTEAAKFDILPNVDVFGGHHLYAIAYRDRYRLICSNRAEGTLTEFFASVHVVENSIKTFFYDLDSILEKALREKPSA
jgi:hypothetical protein